jgi:Domain of unknown function (DUF4918)
MKKQSSMQQPTFGERLYNFYTGLQFEQPLPDGVSVMNPYHDAPTQDCVRAFTEKLYSDTTPRLSCWGINPGRFGGGVTGLSFTDPVVLRENCGIETPFAARRELSAEFVWSIVEAFGGADVFFSQIFLTALCPLGFVKVSSKKVRNGNVNENVNYNFYDDPALLRAVKPFIVETVREQIALGLRTDVAICFGTGKLYTIFDALNQEYGFFERIIPLSHPRFIMQYCRKQLPEYREEYLKTLRDALISAPGANSA